MSQTKPPILDCLGEYCPVPIIRTAKMMASMDKGAGLKLLADDPGVEQDIKDWCRGTGNLLLAMTREGKKFHILLEKA